MKYNFFEYFARLNKCKTRESMNQFANKNEVKK